MATLEDLRVETRRKILFENASRLYESAPPGRE